ncbi:hypothetical protein KIW84_040367 [Lathyrus oleraceus]|uniref:Uncharacterized protein n=1 Tax=Pisum sativum TaxID=3888 RepID=A0A9D4X9U1_PEA|nr:hypothetical protein KIW84_040367 [Pisum sativum]
MDAHFVMSIEVKDTEPFYVFDKQIISFQMEVKISSSKDEGLLYWRPVYRQSIMASKRGCVSRGSSSRVVPTPNAHAFPNLKIISKAHAKKYLKLMDYHVVRERALALEDLQGFGEIGETLKKRRWVSFNNLIHDTNKNIDLEFYANAEFGEIRAQGHKRGNDPSNVRYFLRACVPVYPDDKMISLKALINASDIRRLQNMHQGEAAQNDQQDNQAGNDEEFDQP